MLHVLIAKYITKLEGFVAVVNCFGTFYLLLLIGNSVCVLGSGELAHYETLFWTLSTVMSHEALEYIYLIFIEQNDAHNQKKTQSDS